ncbi:Arylsulfatase [Pontiella desulfatans]|uniref:Arylsulfatase n=2 Tax=Pontiella desulfatans TaxID=2750659 RepID=A0A6C2U8Z9_PONDE|nr:sulfatase S1_27 [Kiritimatiellales bacterium]VGO16530.1 Arylsulfatase [Pontiella desulfatans]
MKTLTRQQFIKVAAAAMPAALATNQAFPAPAPGRRPNLVFVFADQMRASALGCMGNPQVITPNLDRLAGEGLLVTNAVSAQPVCTPYRAHLMTGRYGHTTGVIHNDIRLPDDETVIAERMRQGGYATGYIGKWHLAGNRNNPVDATNRRGWDFWAVRNCSHQHSAPQYWLNDATEPVVVPGWEPEVQTDLALEFIQRKKREPFCLFVSFGPPHNPYKAPEKHTAMYQGKTLTARPNVPSGKTTNLLPYYAMVTSLDECVGRIRDALDEAGIAEDTILVFTSDHGDMLGSQGHRLKQRPWEESIHIPFILRYPRKVRAGQRRDWIVSSVDVMPTLLGLCGLPVPPQVQGLDYSATFTGESDVEREAAFLFNVHQGGGPGTDWRGIRTKQWSYAYHFAGDWVLYDLKQDPHQLNNLIDDPKHAARKKELHQQLEALRATLGESRPLKGKMPAAIQLG